MTPTDRYRGRAGATRRERVLWACPCGAHHAVELVLAIDAQADPALARRALDGDVALRQVSCPVTGQRHAAVAPLVFHDPARGVLALVLGEGDRRRELHERAALLTLMAEDAAQAVPRYALEFAVVYGADGLRALVGEAAEEDAGVIEIVEKTQPGGSGPTPAPAGERWPGGRDPVVRRVGPDGAVQLLVRAGRAERELLTDAGLEVRVQLHRMPNYPLVTLVFGTAASLAGRGAPFTVSLDFAADADRAVLAALGKSFDLQLELYDRDAGDTLLRRRRVSAPLADNARCAVAGAGDYLKRVPSAERSYGKALASFLAPDYDRLGLAAPVAAELDEAALDAFVRPAEAVRALRVVRRFSEPASEDWLTLTRGYPVERWHARRKAVVERAVELGLWPGAVAATVAVSENLARSRKDLVVRLMRSFANLLSDPSHGLDEAAVRDNWDALRAEATALGVPPAEWSAPRSEPIVSESEPVASGTIGEVTELLPVLEAARSAEETEAEAAPRPARTAARARAGSNGRRGRTGSMAGPVEHMDDAALLRLLDHRERRMPAAIELARRGDSQLAGPVFAALDSMSRGEAGRVLGSAIGFGRSAEPHLLALLTSRKGFLRQGAALSLAVLHGETGREAICDLLLDEPTEIWREVARALGESGAAAVMPLVSRLGGKGDEARERVAWALAHIAARGGRRPIETVAAGRDAAAAGVARYALELADAAGTDHRLVRSEPPPRDQTVNRAFSRQFFAAMASDPAAPAIAPVDTSAPAMLLDESDVLESVDLDAEESELDERDLIP
ncbi:MAG TPA: CpXC domain-containing protein [Kofleriaceae bacterium]|nr:CpXC domain-containing protein [Kofleriaceae bacterium]